MRYAFWMLLMVLTLTAPAMAADPASIVLDDFSYPAWGVRWTTLEFSQFTPPEMTVTKEAGPDGTPAGQVNLPAGGRIVLTTAEEVEAFDTIRGKPPIGMLGGPKALAMQIKAAGEQPVDVTFIVREKAPQQGAAKEARTETVTVKPGEWTKVQVAVPSMALPMSLVGVELKRQGEPAKEPQPVLLDDLRVLTELAATDKPLVVTAGRTSYDESAVAGKPVELFARVQGLAPAVDQCKMGGSISYQGPAGATGAWKWSSADKAWKVVDAKDGGTASEPDAVALKSNQATILNLPFTTEKPGLYTVELVFNGDQKVKFTFAVYGDKLLTGLKLEDADVNKKRIESATTAMKDFGGYLTNLSPAVAFRSSGKQFKLFGDINAGQAIDLPKYVAVPEKGGVKVYTTDEAISLANMNQPWLVFFAGDAKGWSDIKINNRGRKIDAPMDLPWLVVLQRRPDSLSKVGTSLVLEYPKAADFVALMPLHGVRTFSPTETAGWAKNGLPEAEVKHAVQWSRRLFRMPVYVKEDFKVDAKKDIVTVRQMFDTVDLRGDWNIEGDPFAPIPPMLAMAWQNKFPVKFLSFEGKELQPTDGAVASAVGPVMGIAGYDNYTYEIHGMLKYINEDRQPVLQGGGEWGDKLRKLIQAQAPAKEGDEQYGEPETSPTRWSPGLTEREDYGLAMIGNSERQGLLGSTIPYVDSDQATWRKRTLKVDALYLLNPNTVHPVVDERTGRVHNMEGRAWAQFHNWVDNNAYSGDILRALDYYVQYTGDLELIRAHWPYIRSTFAVVCDFKRHGEWELCCFNVGGGDSWDSVYGGLVGFARLADRMGDGESYRYACYYFAKHAATLAGQRQVNKFVAAQPYWPSLLADAQFTPEGKIGSYSIDVLKWTKPAAGIEDLVFSDVWGQNYGLRAWNQTVFMRGSRSEYRLAGDIVPDYVKYWLDGRVQKFAPQWYQKVIVEQAAPPKDALDLRTGLPVTASEGDCAGRINIAARAIVMGDSIDKLWGYYQLKTKGVRVQGSDGRVPRVCTLVALLEDGTNQPWVRLFGQADGAVSSGWERGRDAYMDLGEENYMYGLEFKASGVRPYWAVFVAPNAKENVHFGFFGPAGALLENTKTTGVSWNTSALTATLSQAEKPAATAPVGKVSPEPAK